MTDIEILISNLRGNPNNVFMTQAADTIEQLVEKVDQLEADNNSYLEAFADLHNEMANLYDENAKLEAERDAAIACIPRACGFCKWYVEADDECVRKFPCNNISGINTGWEWRGVDG